MPPFIPLDLVPESEILSRVLKIQKQMAARDLEGILLTHRPDIYYFTGTAQDGWVYLSQTRDPLVLIKRSLARARAETPLTQVIPVSSVTQIPEKIKETQGRLPQTLGLAFDLVPVRDYRFFKDLFSDSRFSDASPLIHGCRSIKSPFEIQALERAARASARVFSFIETQVRPGIRETDLAGRIEAFARTLGHSGRIQMRHYRSEGFSFHIMSGRSGGMPGALDSPVSGTGTCTAYPFGAGPKPLEANEPVLVDFAAMIQGYHMDESRMFCAGSMDKAARAASEAAMDLLAFIKEGMKPGAVMGELFEASVSFAGKLGVSEAYLGLPGQKSSFVGHGIGLELVEPPILARGRSQVLEPGMVLAVEPKLVFQDRFAAGIESVILVTEEGSRLISQTPHRIFEVPV